MTVTSACFHRHKHNYPITMYESIIFAMFIPEIRFLQTSEEENACPRDAEKQVFYSLIEATKNSLGNILGNIPTGPCT